MNIGAVQIYLMRDIWVHIKIFWFEGKSQHIFSFESLWTLRRNIWGTGDNWDIKGISFVIFLRIFADRDHFQLGSLSHLLNAKAAGYQELPDWPESAPDPSVRNVEVKDSVCAGRTVLTEAGPEGAGVLHLQTTRGSFNMQDLPKKHP